MRPDDRTLLLSPNDSPIVYGTFESGEAGVQHVTPLSSLAPVKLPDELRAWVLGLLPTDEASAVPGASSSDTQAAQGVIDHALLHLALASVAHSGEKDVRFRHLDALSHDPHANGFGQAYADFREQFGDQLSVVENADRLSIQRRVLNRLSDDLRIPEPQLIERCKAMVPVPDLYEQLKLRDVVADRITLLANSDIGEDAFRERVAVLIEHAEHVGVRFKGLSSAQRGIVCEILRAGPSLSSFNATYHDASNLGLFSHGLGAYFASGDGFTQQQVDEIDAVLRGRNPTAKISWSPVPFEWQ